MKKRSKQKATAQQRAHQQAFSAVSPATLIRRARTFPIYECLITHDWKKNEMGLVQIIVSRQQPDGNICFGVYLVDPLCLGLKNTFANADYSPARYHSDVVDRVFRETQPDDCPVELAHQMIYQSIEYAAQFGFEPEKDYALSQYILAPRGELKEPYKLTFGKDGKPFFVSGPRDNVARILRQLEKTAGEGNFHFMAGFGDI